MIKPLVLPVGAVLALGFGVAVSTGGWSSHAPSIVGDHTEHAHAPYTHCAEVDVSLSGGATAVWADDLGPSRRWTPKNPEVVLEAGVEEGISLSVVAEVYFGGAQIIVHDEVHELAANERLEVPIDLRSVSSLHPQQHESDALVRVGAFELDRFGNRVGNYAMLDDLVFRDESSGRLGMRVHLDQEVDPLDGEPPVLSDAEIESMKDRAHARRAQRRASDDDPRATPGH